MAVAWTSDEHDAVDAILNTYPAPSGRCLEAARGLLPIGQARDPATCAWKIKPRQGRFVVPKIHTSKRWFHHYTVEVERHGVDALTGASGTPWNTYLSTHWEYANYLDCLKSDLQDEDQ
jgi:hypothetical protein